MRVVFFGDSITKGQWVSPHRTWVHRLSADIEQLIKPQPVVAACGVNGNTTRQALERMPYDVQNDGVRVIFIQFGLNDCNYWPSDAGVPRVSPLAFEANLMEIVARAEAHGARVCFVITNHPTNKTLKGVDVDYQESNRQYNKIVRRVGSRMENIVLIDIEAGFEQRFKEMGTNVIDYLEPDGIHLSEAGHDLYYEIISAHITESADRVRSAYST